MEQQAGGDSPSWNILVCGDVDDIFGVLVSNPENCNVHDLKKLIASKSAIDVELQTLFFEEKRLDDKKALAEYHNLATGSALYLARKPFILQTQDCFGEKSTLKISRKRSWPISQLREMIGFKYRLPLNTFVLMCDGDILEDGPADELKTLANYPQIVDNCLITVTPIRRFYLQVPKGKTTKRAEVLICPLNSSNQFMEDMIEERTGFISNQIQWSKSSSRIQGTQNVLYIQTLDGTSVPITIPASELMHVMHLRELIKEATGIPTHQQRLTVGTTVLEDWDEEGCIMHLRNYPAIHDGATIYLIQLTVGIKFKTTSYIPKASSHKNVPYKMCVNENQNRQYAYVNIPDPQKCTQGYLNQILDKLGAMSKTYCCHWEILECKHVDRPVSEMTCDYPGCSNKWYQQ